MNRQDIKDRLAEALGINFHMVLEYTKYSEEDYQEIREYIVNVAKKYLENKGWFYEYPPPLPRQKEIKMDELLLIRTHS